FIPREQWHHSRNPMASWCTRCGQQDPRYLPCTFVRITEAEMRAYHHFLGSCIRLEYMAKKGTVRAMMPFSYVYNRIECVSTNPF
uniref:Uncharacterized protein n=1 Tax=Phocoena sinus TaxID=42100 RepID=A0A8C9B729_PHOSS